MDKCKICKLIALNLDCYNFEDGAAVIIPHHILLDLLKQIKILTEEKERAES